MDGICTYPNCFRPAKYKGLCKRCNERNRVRRKLGLTHDLPPGHKLPLGSTIKNNHGYLIVKVSFRQPCYKPQHRALMEKHLGRELLRHESVHHRNGVRDDNRLENLELWSNSHPSGQKVVDKVEWARKILATYGDLLDRL